jgi:tetratricopeptide (TPR) repeat protein
MVCPECGSNVSDNKNRCERCGTNLTLFTMILGASNRYYNNGLAKAKVRDLSGAAVALRNSLELNKKNTAARNLLGLIYFEMGEPVAALSEWVISKHFKPKDNIADRYIEDVQKNPTKLENLNQTIKKYNAALSYARQGSSDLALLQLKKVISLNPRFIRAYLLIALLYIKNGEHERAKRYLLKANRIDASNIITLRYLREIEEAVSVQKPEVNAGQDEAQNVSSIMPISSYKEDKPNIMAYVNLVIGIVIGVAIMAILVVPNLEKKYTENKPDYANQTAMTAQLEEKNNEITALNADKETLDKKIEELKEKVKEMEKANETGATIYDTLFTANESYMEELKKSSSKQDFEKAADLLVSIDTDKFKSEVAKSFYNNLKDKIFPDASEKSLKKGRALLDDNKFDEALKALAKAIDYDPDNVEAIYFTGRTYQNLKDNENAALYFNKVINDYPENSYWVNYAKSHLPEVQ